MRECAKHSPNMPKRQSDEETHSDSTTTDHQPRALKVAHIIRSSWGVEAPNGFLTVVFAAHEWSCERVKRVNREPRKHAKVRWVDADAIPKEFVNTTASALHRDLDGGPEVSLDGWK